MGKKVWSMCTVLGQATEFSMWQQPWKVNRIFLCPTAEKELLLLRSTMATKFLKPRFSLVGWIMTTQRRKILIPRIYLIWKKRSLRLSILSLPCIIQVGLNDITNVFVTGNEEFGETHRKGTQWRWRYRLEKYGHKHRNDKVSYHSRGKEWILP